MPRIQRVTSQDAGVQTKIAYLFTRRAIAKLTGRETERMLEPLEVRAHSAKALQAYGKLEQASAKLTSIDTRLSLLGQLKAATMTSCEYCIDMGSQIARRSGLTDEQLLALPNYRESGLFDPVETLVLDYAVGISRTPADVSDALVAQLHEHLSDEELVELTHMIALENYRGRFNLALDIGSAGFSDGMVCAVPERTPASLDR